MSTPVTEATTLRSAWSISACSLGSAPSCRTAAANDESRHRLNSALPAPVRTLASSDASSSINGRMPSRAATCVRASRVEGSMASGSSALYLRGESGKGGTMGAKCHFRPAPAMAPWRLGALRSAC